MMFEIRKDDLSNAQTRDLLALHLSGMRSSSPPENVFALDVAGLAAADVTVWTAWRHERIAGMGALRMLGRRQGEIKSMRTHPDFLRMGAGAAILETIIEQARYRDLHRLSLETGSGTAFEPALALYRQRGFVSGDAFSDYVATDFNRFLHLVL